MSIGLGDTPKGGWCVTFYSFEREHTYLEQLALGL